MQVTTSMEVYLSGQGLEIAVSTEFAQIEIGDDFGVQTTDARADTDAVGKILIGACEHGDQIGTATAFIVVGQRLRAGRAPDLNQLAFGAVKVNKGSIHIADNRAESERANLTITLQLNGQTGKTFKRVCTVKQAMAVVAITFCNNPKSLRGQACIRCWRMMMRDIAIYTSV